MIDKVNASLQVMRWLENRSIGNPPVEAIRVLYEEFMQHDSEMVKALAMTFETPRKSYLKSREWYSVGNIWRSGILSAGETGTDEHGEYQVFSLSELGREYLSFKE